jgi:hypothetical protein
MKPQSNDLQKRITSLEHDVKKVFNLAYARVREAPDRSIDRLDLTWWICIKAQLSERRVVNILSYLVDLKLINLFCYKDRPCRYVFKQEVIDIATALTVARELELTSSGEEQRIPR